MDRLATKLQNVTTVAILGHVRPDGDCTGSTLATYNYIKTYFPEIDVTVYLQEIPDVFKFLSGADLIRHSYAPELQVDLCLVHDCADLDRLGEFGNIFTQARYTICLDHHASNSGFADEAFIFPNLSSTAELMFDMIGEESLTKEIAECIYTGIINDTGVFQYSSTTSKTMYIAGKCMDAGIHFTKIVDDTFYTRTYNQTRITGHVLLNSKLYMEGLVIAGSVSIEEMKAFDVRPKDLDGIVNQLRVNKGVEVALFIYELEKGYYKISLRSNGDVNVAIVCAAFGGGGHVKAAGGELRGDLEEVIQEICEEIQKQLTVAVRTLPGMISEKSNGAKEKYFEEEDSITKC